MVTAPPPPLAGALPTPAQAITAAATSVDSLGTSCTRVAASPMVAKSARAAMPALASAFSCASLRPLALRMFFSSVDRDFGMDAPEEGVGRVGDNATTRHPPRARG